MLFAVLVLQIALLCAVAVLLLRKAQVPLPDPRQAGVPDQITRLDSRSEAVERQLRDGLAQVRADLAVEAHTSREANAAAAGALRTEVLHTVQSLGSALNTGLDGFRADNKAAAETLRTAVQQALERLDQRFIAFSSEAARHQIDAQTALHARLSDLGASNGAQQEKLRTAVQERLESLTTSNAAKLEEMRATVDEKLQKTLETRLTASFGQVTTHLGEVQKGLGEMKLLATGVGDLKKVLTNVKTRGMVGEFQLGQQLEQMFSPEQYLKNARIKQGTTESVEYALKFPNGEGPGGYTLLPIDAKFPKEAWETLEHAYEHGSADEIADAGKLFERVIKAEADRICKKYIDPPVTLPHAVMFLPTENLYAEVVRRPGLQSQIQSSCNVTVAGPSTFMAILTSFQMGFHSLAIQKKGDEVWKVLSKAKTEFGTFGTLMEKVEKQVGTVQNTLRDLNSKTTTINRALKNVSNLETGPNTDSLLAFEELASIVPSLAAATSEE